LELAVALTKRPGRRKKIPLLPARQVICGNCGTRLFTDDSPAGTFPPPYSCLNCKSTSPPTKEQEVARIARQREWVARQAPSTIADKDQIARGENGFRVSEPKELTPEQLAAQTKADRIEEILAKDPKDLTPAEWEWLRADAARLGLDKDEPTNRGRKRDTQYDEAQYEIARAKLHGQPMPTITGLAERFAVDESRPEYRVDRLRHALKSREKHQQPPDPPKPKPKA
jgi:hypothetical protein